MAIKRKTTTRIVKGAAVSNGAVSKTTVTEEEPDMDVDKEIEDQEEEEEQESEEDKLARLEEETVATRKKELKSMAVGDVKGLLVSAGLDTEKMKKDDLITALLAHEAKAREATRAHEAKVRAIIVKKKDELEALSISDLSKMCTDLGIQGARKKDERVRFIIERWQKDDGVEKALEEMARQQRVNDLQTMDLEALRALCEANNIDPCVKEVMADRVAKAEKAAGRFARPNVDQKENVNEKEKGGDLVDTLLANESARKAAQKKQAAHEEAIKAKLTELKGKSIEELKKLLRKHGSEVEGKKDKLVEALHSKFLEQDAVDVRKSELKAMAIPDLKALVTAKSIECGHSKEKMIEAVLGYESKCREEAKAFDLKASDIIADKKAELDGKTATELKDLCAAKSLAIGGGKEDKITRLLEQARADGEIDLAISSLLFRKRKEDLLSMEKADLLPLCEKTGADPCVKEVMIERVLAYEDENGCVEPPAKKGRKSQKS